MYVTRPPYYTRKHPLIYQDIETPFPMRIVHVLPTLGKEASGPVYSVSRLCDCLVAHGIDLVLATTNHSRAFSYPSYARVFSLGPGPRNLCLSSAMARWLTREATLGRVNIIHSHGLWTMANVYPGWAKKSSPNCKLVLSPRGTLSPWALNYNSIRKRLFYFVLQGQALRQADAFHATAELEYRDLRRLGFKQPVCIIPNGIDIPPLGEKNIIEPPYTVLFLARVHPTKAVEYLLEAWHLVFQQFPQWVLRIAGPGDENYLRELHRLAQHLDLKRVTWVGPIYGQDKLDEYRRSLLYVLPSHSENYGITVAEALAAGTPVITTKGTPWQELHREGAGWWIDVGAEPLAACLKEALSLPPETLRDMGLRGRSWVERCYSWPSIARQMCEFYQWLLKGGPPPVSVRIP